MSYALWRMCHNSKNHCRIVSSKDYAFARKHHISSMRTRTITEKTRKKLSASLKGRETPWAINNIPKDLPYNGNAKVWDVTDPNGKVYRLIGHEFSSFCKSHSLSQGNLSGSGKTKGYSAICHGNYYQWIKNQK